MNFSLPVRLFTGPDCLQSNAGLISELGSSCLIVTSGSAAMKSGALDAVCRVLDSQNIRHSTYDRVTPNPTVSSCMEAGRLAAELGAEFILGIGGGSPLDAAKAAAVFAANPRLDEDSFYGVNWSNKPLPIVLLGTTAGTGSEVTNVSVLLDSRGRKHSIHHPLLYAALSFGDPTFTMTLPLSATISTGIDVLAHCGESYFTKKATELSRAFAVRGIRLLLPALREAAEAFPPELDCRERLYQASILGGLAISVTGTCFPHNVGYYFTENYGLPHGIASALLLPALLDHVEAADPVLTAAFYDETGTSRDELLTLLKTILPPVDISLTDEEIEAALPRWENNGSVKNTIGTVTLSDLRHFLRTVSR